MASSLPTGDALRLQAELEFIQCLGNPNYLTFLSQHGYFDDKRLINYLDYLQYWKRPEYACYLRYPQCLFFLDLLQHAAFRTHMASAPFSADVANQQLLHWIFYNRNRARPAPQDGAEGEAQ